MVDKINYTTSLGKCCFYFLAFLSIAVILFLSSNFFFDERFQLYYNLSTIRDGQQEIWNKNWKMSTPNPCDCYDYNQVINTPNSGAWIDLFQNATQPDDKLDILETEIEKQLNYLNAKTNCSPGPTLHCGHFGSCGLACQLAHRTICLMLSYTMAIPLIHSTNDGWRKYPPWETFFQRLGSACTVDDNTIYVNWTETGPEMRYAKPCSVKTDATPNNCSNKSRIAFPLTDGIPIAKEMLDILGKVHQNPFLWYLGQFVKYTMRHSERMESVIAHEKTKEIDLMGSVPTAGIHVRRSDKIFEYKKTYYNLSEYMKPVDDYFRQTYGNGSEPRLVYVASDDHNVLPEAQKTYTPPIWKIIGFQTTVSHTNESQRWNEDALVSIILDMHFLSKSEYLVCGLSSNVCRKLFELMATRWKDVHARVKSLDVKYHYLIFGFTLPLNLNPF